ncbi:manganese efflux pump MntP family protein [Glaciecola sp. 1036]|uniref:manganese efflux pump MntP n=1 Tax=Alteromonadaceae TaxID=72275 RepID=UPI003D02954B
MFEVIVLGIGLSMDAFAVAVGFGAKKYKNPVKIALLSGSYFGIFHGIMPAIGYLIGVEVVSWMEEYARWISFFLLLFVGGKMIYEAATGLDDDNVEDITHKVLLLLAFVISIDAMAAGFTLSLLAVNGFIACISIAIITFLCTCLGVLVGNKTGVRFEEKAEFAGGIILILIGCKIVFF